MPAHRDNPGDSLCAMRPQRSRAAMITAPRSPERLLQGRCAWALVRQSTKATPATRRYDYAVTGSKILELAKSAHNLFIQQNSQDQARLLKTLVSNCTFDRGSLLATYRKRFDLLVEGNENGNWLGGRDSNPDNVVQSHVSYR